MHLLVLGELHPQFTLATLAFQLEHILGHGKRCHQPKNRISTPGATVSNMGVFTLNQHFKFSLKICGKNLCQALPQS